MSSAAGTTAVSWIEDTNVVVSEVPARLAVAPLRYELPFSVIVSVEDKEEAVRQVSGSVTFHRSDVLRALLEYLHHQEGLGRAHEVTESEIALKVMGRGKLFTPESDSSVRTRFLALRKKLDEFYSGEGREAPAFVLGLHREAVGFQGIEDAVSAGDGIAVEGDPTGSGCGAPIRNAVSPTAIRFFADWGRSFSNPPWS